MSHDISANIDQSEIAKFNALAARWWDPEGEFKSLHEINPLRLGFIRQHAEIANRLVLDIGCGGGILAESMAVNAANVTGIDMAEEPLKVARLHLKETGQQVDYQQKTAEHLADETPSTFDVITCMELLEHVPEPLITIQACAKLVRPGGDVFFSTINRNPKAFAGAIVAAEYILHLIPKGTHEYAKFIKPSELEGWARSSGLQVKHMTGMHYNPLTRKYFLARNTDINYLMHFRMTDD